jgi:hypothetical protein
LNSSYLDPTTYPNAHANYVSRLNRFPSDYISYGKAIMKVCQKYTKRNMQASFFLCDSGYSFLGFPVYGQPLLNKRNITKICTDKDCNDYSQLWKIMNSGPMKQYLQIEKLKKKFPIEDEIHEILSQSSKFRNHSANQDIEALLPKEIKILYFTGEYDAYTPIAAFENMLSTIDYTSLDKSKEENMSWGVVKESHDGKVMLARLNFVGSNSTLRNKVGAYLMIKRWLERA